MHCIPLSETYGVVGNECKIFAFKALQMLFNHSRNRISMLKRKKSNIDRRFHKYNNHIDI